MPSSGPVYQGRAGQTRTERVHLVELDGSVRSVEVHRVVNVATIPSSSRACWPASCTAWIDGRELALPFVYHDPERAQVRAGDPARRSRTSRSRSGRG